MGTESQSFENQSSSLLANHSPRTSKALPLKDGNPIAVTNSYCYLGINVNINIILHTHSILCCMYAVDTYRKIQVTLYEN